MNAPATTSRAAGVRTRSALPMPSDVSSSTGFVATALLYEGPWSRVYRVRPASSEHDDRGVYVLKLPFAEGDQASVAENMLRREASVLRSVTQPNLIAVLDGRFDGRPYLLTPFLEGATLQDVFDAGLRCPLPHALWITRQIAQALAALHEAGWRHGDVKPQNVLIAPSGHVTLLDLGLAHRLDAPPTSTPATSVSGSLAYLAPECLQHDRPVARHADIYSLGAVLFQMVAGRPPFVAPNAASLADAHRHAAPPELPVAGSPVASDVRQLFAQMLAKDPLRRPSSASVLAQRLMRLEIATLQERVTA